VFWQAICNFIPLAKEFPMKRFVIAILAVGLLAGCGARTEVAKEKLLKKIDSMLGEMDVKRKDIQMQMTGLKQGVEGLGKAKIKAQVKQEQIERDMQPLQERIDRVDAALKTIRPHLDKKEKVEIASVSYTPEKVKEMAGALLNERKTLASRLDSLNQAKASLGKTVSVLQQRQDDYKAALGKLENQVSEIDAKMIAAKAMQEASASMGESEASLATNVSNLEGKVRDLLADVTSTVLSENEKWDEARATKEIDGVDAALSKIEGPAATAAEIDKILGSKK
jgi:chromosome segregation ATPase